VDVVQQLNSIRRSHSIFNTAATPCDISWFVATVQIVLMPQLWDMRLEPGTNSS
jgi:hypothetical protein